MADMLTLDKVDLCVHRWESVPCIDLATLERWSIHRCHKCDFTKGSRQNRNPNLPTVGKGASHG